MKTIILAIIWISIGWKTSVAQKNITLDDLLTNYNALSQELKTTTKKSVRRKQDRAAIQLVNYINKQGYPLTITTTQPLLVYAAPYPCLGAVIDTLVPTDLVQVYDKDRHGYYKVATVQGEGYVQGIAANLPNNDHPLHLLDEMLVRAAAVDKMLEQARRQPRMRFDASFSRPENATIR